MTISTLQKMGVALLCLLMSAVWLGAQDNKITIVKKITREDGSVTIEKQDLPSGEPLLNYLQYQPQRDGKNVEIQIASDIIEFDTENGETLFRMRSTVADPDKNQRHPVLYHITSSGGDARQQVRMQRDPCKVFIGVGTNQISQGLRVDYTVAETPAQAANVQAGDIILALDGVPIKTQAELTHERDKHQPGDAFTLTILRGEAEMILTARFRECSETNREAMRLQEETTRNLLERTNDYNREWEARREVRERPILGIYVDEAAPSAGVLISSVSQGKGAALAGLQSGDVITKVNGQTVNNSADLRRVLSNKKAADTVTVVYLRNGKFIETPLIISSERSFYYRHTIERDPCAVFIGVYTTDLREQGVRVTGVIESTPAKNSGVQVGDIILALDDVPVATHLELRRERDKHKAGETFTLLVMRDGEYKEIDATFINCAQQTPTEPAVEVVEMEEADNPAENKLEQSMRNLAQEMRVEAFRLYPNPTVGQFNLQFEAEVGALSICIADAAGKVVYNEEIPQFNGSYNRQLSLAGATPGTYVLTLKQGDKILSRKLLLLPKV
ncbi:MAG TPA: PDZ domain-containing protein [Saprospiraceae bacterium]|nr:PDZ domain-containing protein [Saprospiraceae bacterium]HMP12976.1 PDZ domain-containing protein [Saprospiraceae bacterium]